MRFPSLIKESDSNSILHTDMYFAKFLLHYNVTRKVILCRYRNALFLIMQHNNLSVVATQRLRNSTYSNKIF
jgi:hypothetical protein